MPPLVYLNLMPMMSLAVFVLFALFVFVVFLFEAVFFGNGSRIACTNASVLVSLWHLCLL